MKQPIRLEELDAGHPLRQHPFEGANAGVPEGYFDTLASRVQAQVAKPQEASPLVSWSWGRTMASLAGAGLVAALVWVTWPERQDSIGQDTLSGVSDAAIVAYLDEQGLNPDEVTTLHAAAPPSQNTSPTRQSTELKYLDLKSDAIKQYIDEQGLDEELTNTDS